MDKLFQEQAQSIGIIMAQEEIQDPFEKNVDYSELNPLPIRAIVSDLTATQAQWKMIGISVTKAKEIIIEKKHRSLIEASYKILIDGEIFYGWKVSGRMQIREEGNYLRCYVYIKKEV